MRSPTIATTPASDVSHSLISDILRDLLARLRKKAWLNDQKATLDIDNLVNQAESELVGPCADRGDDPPSLREKASLYGLIEFMRAVHAEMAAISSAARRGIGINGCTIFSTTFPCHECARHIVAAGLTKAVFIDPYPKSRVGEMFDDSIAVDEEDDKRIPFLPYVGVSPRMYLQLFRAPKRRNPDGTLVNWEAIRRTQSPRLARSDYGYIEVEAESMDVFNQLLKSRLPGATKSGGHNG